MLIPADHVVQIAGDPQTLVVHGLGGGNLPLASGSSDLLLTVTRP